MVLLIWHGFAAGFLSFRTGSNSKQVHVDAILIEKGFKGRNLINALQNSIRQKYPEHDFVYHYDCVGNEFCVPSSCG